MHCKGKEKAAEITAEGLALFSVPLARHQDRQQNAKMGPEVEKFRFGVNPLLATLSARHGKSSSGPVKKKKETLRQEVVEVKER